MLKELAIGIWLWVAIELGVFAALLAFLMIPITVQTFIEHWNRNR